MHADSTQNDTVYGIAPTDIRIAYRVRDAADVVGLSERQMWDLVGRGDIESFKIGTSRRILRAALVDFIERQTDATATHPPAGPSTPPPPSGPKAHNASPASLRRAS